MTLDERMELAKRYYEVFGSYHKPAKTIIEECEKLKILGCEWGEVTFDEYGRIGHDFRLIKGGHITNKTTDYEFDNNSYYIHWDNGNVGRLMFLGLADYTEEENKIWEEFDSELMTYNPLDYDRFNCHKVYSIEDGKKLMDNYKDICKRTGEKFAKYCKKRELEKTKAKYEKLLKELPEE